MIQRPEFRISTEMTELRMHIKPGSIVILSSGTNSSLPLLRYSPNNQDALSSLIDFVHLAQRHSMYLFVAMQIIHILYVVVGVSSLAVFQNHPGTGFRVWHPRPSWLWKALKNLDLLNAFEPYEVDLVHTAMEKKKRDKTLSFAGLHLICCDTMINIYIYTQLSYHI